MLAAILALVEESGNWPHHLLDAYIVMISEEGGDAITIGQRPLSLLPFVYRLWSTVRLSHIQDWFESWLPESVSGCSSVPSASKCNRKLFERDYSCVAKVGSHRRRFGVVKDSKNNCSCIAKVGSYMKMTMLRKCRYQFDQYGKFLL